MISFVAFSLRRAWQGFWRNGVMSVAATATMVLMLLLLAGFWIVQTGLSAGIEYVEQKVQVVADLNDGVSDADVAALRVQIAAMPEVADVEYITKDQAAADFKQREAEAGRTDLTGYLDTNPFPASLQVRLKDPKNYGDVVTTLQGQSIVERVLPVESVVDRLLTVTAILRTVGLIVLALVGLTVLFIIINTIRLAVVARAEEIEIMRLVGASDAFVRWPFIFEGALVGLLGALVTLALFALVADPLSSTMARFFEVVPLRFGSLVRDVVILVLGTGLGLGAFGAWVSVRSYLAR
ncbi:MAG: permease-like cell division protein FtsX [Candidatus Limnocylindrales bacterium]